MYKSALKSMFAQNVNFLTPPPALLVPVCFTCSPSSTYVCFIELPSPLSKKVIFRMKNGGVKREKRLNFFFINSTWTINIVFHSYIYIKNKNTYSFINVYDFLIKNAFICWTRLKIEKILATAKQLIPPPVHFDSAFKDSPPPFATNVILKFSLITTTSIFPTLNLNYYVVGRLANSMFQFKNWKRVLCHTK